MSPMLSDMIIVRAAMGDQRLDLHKHATFRCKMKKFFRNIGKLIR